MSLTAPPRVFISYTGEDLKAHADTVADVVRALEWIAVDHRDWAATGQPSVEECRRHVGRCNLLVVLVAQRYGWVPTAEEGGDGERSITWLEVAHARSLGLPVLPFLLEDDASWPMKHIEGLKDAKAQERLGRFKTELRKGVAGFFTDPRSLDGPVTRALLQRAEQLSPPEPKPPVAPPTAAPPSPGGVVRTPAEDEEEAIIPWNPDPSNPPSLADRLAMKVPKRILSIDGKMSLSAISFGFLERVESLLRARYDAPDLRLSDYFDLIGGTGLSSLIAAALAAGHEVATVRDIFLKRVEAFFDKSFILNRLKNLYDSRTAESALAEVFGDATLGDLTPEPGGLKTGLCVVATRLDEQRPYPFLNDPRAPNFNDLAAVKLRDVVMAGASMPIYYRPKPMELGASGAVEFVSGDMSVGNDPALYLFLLVTSASFPLRWRIGKRRLYLLSVGAGQRQRRAQGAETSTGSAFTTLVMLPSLLTSGTEYQSQMLLRSLAWDAKTDGNADNTLTELAEADPILTYQRYDVSLDPETLTALGAPSLAEGSEALRPDSVEHLSDLVRIGVAAAAEQVKPEHFIKSFDVRKPVGLVKPAGGGQG